MMTDQNHVFWLACSAGFDENRFEELKHAIERSSDCSMIEITWDGGHWDPGSFDPNNKNIVCYGSLNFVNKFGKGCFPGAFGLTNNTNTHVYMAYFPREWFLNDDAIWMPYGLFRKNFKKIIQDFRADEVFIRPDSGRKSFTGFVLHSEISEREMSALDQIQKPDLESFIVVASKKDIRKEVRCVIADRHVITASTYGWDGAIEEECKDPFFLAKAQQIADYEWQPDIVYTVDLGLLSNNTIKIIEFNSFSCAGLYACNKQIIVDRINEIARNEWDCNS